MVIYYSLEFNALEALKQAGLKRENVNLSPRPFHSWKGGGSEEYFPRRQPQDGTAERHRQGWNERRKPRRP